MNRVLLIHNFYVNFTYLYVKMYPVVCHTRTAVYFQNLYLRQF